LQDFTPDELEAIRAGAEQEAIDGPGAGPARVQTTGGSRTWT
jgi:hypothetical protein